MGQSNNTAGSILALHGLTRVRYLAYMLWEEHARSNSWKQSQEYPLSTTKYDTKTKQQKNQAHDGLTNVLDFSPFLESFLFEYVFL